MNNKNLKGSYGVFLEGVAYLRLYNKNKEIKEIELIKVNPLKSFLLDVNLFELENIKKIELIIRDNVSKNHLLDSILKI